MQDQGFTTGIDGAGRKMTDLDEKVKKTTQTTRQLAPAGHEVGRQTSKGFEQASHSVGGLSAAMGKVKTVAAGLGLVMGAQQAVKFFTGAIDSAREAEAIMFRTKSTFADAADGVDEWAKTTASGFRMSEDAAKSSALTFSTFGLAAGLAGQDLATFSTDLTELAGDLAAYGDYDIAEVVNDMSSALSGSAIPMRKYGVLLDDAALREIAFANGITESNRQLSAKEKAAATVIGMQQELAYSNDAAANSSETYGAALASLKAKFADVSVEIGQKLMPIAQAVVSLLAGPGLAALSGFGAALEPVGALIGVVASAFSALPAPIQAAIGLMIAAKLAAMALSTEMVRGLGVKALSGAVMGMMSLRSPVDMAKAGFASMKAGAKNLLSALGGPWMIGLAAAAYGVSKFVAAKKDATAAGNEMSDSAKNVAAAMADNGVAFGDANPKISKFATEAASAALESARLVSVGKNLADVLGDVGVNADVAARGLAGNKKAAEDTLKALKEKADLEAEGNKERIGGGKSAIGALWSKITTGDSGTEPSKVAREAYEKMVRETEEELERLTASSEAIQTTLKVGLDVDLNTAGITAITDAMESFNDETKSAVDRIGALSKALDQVWADKFTQEASDYAFGDAIDGFTDALDEFDMSLVNADGSINLMNESGRKLHDTMGDNVSAMNQQAATMLLQGDSISDITTKMGEQRQAFIDAAVAKGMDLKVATALADEYHMFPDEITTYLQVQGIEAANDLIDIFDGKVTGMPDHKTIKLESLTEEAEKKLDDTKFKVERVPGSKEVKVTALTADAELQLGLVNNLVETSNAKTVDVSSPEGKNVIAELEKLNITTQSDNEKIILIDHPTAEVTEMMKTLGMEIRKTPDGKFEIVHNIPDVKRAKKELEFPTFSKHTVTVRQAGAAGPWSTWAGADGGVRSRADGALDTAQIQKGNGAGRFQMSKFGPVQWAEGETDWEAFIPGALSKRGRSTQILQETADRMGYGLIPSEYMKMADGGISASELDQFAQGIEGNPYTWGGSGSWNTDCSGGVSAVANKATGRDPFGSRTSTATMGSFLAERGFVPGLGGAGALSVGWLNGGPGGGHTALTLPSGTNVEMGGAGGDGQYGGIAAGASDPMFTDHMHLPAESFTGGDADAGLEGRELTQKEQYAKAIMDEAYGRGLGDEGARIGLATALAESDMQMYANASDPESMGYAHDAVGSDHDSSGLFQQRNNGAWGTAGDRMDAQKSAAMFYDELEKNPDWRDMDAGAAAQSVQRSAVPDAYDKRMAEADELMASVKSAQGDAGGGIAGSSSGGTGNPVYVTNWPSGMGGSYSGGGSSFSSSGGGSSYSTPTPTTVMAEVVDEEEQIDHAEIARATMRDGGQKAAESALNSLLGDLGLNGSGFLPTLFKSAPGIADAFREKGEKDMPIIQNHYNVTLADLEAFKRDIERNTNRQIMQYGGGR